MNQLLRKVKLLDDRIIVKKYTRRNIYINIYPSNIYQGDIDLFCRQVSKGYKKRIPNGDLDSYYVKTHVIPALFSKFNK